MSRMRVLHVVGDLELGGGQKLAVLTAQFLDRSRFDVSVLSFGRPGPYSERLRRDGIEVVELGLDLSLGKNRVRSFVRAARLLLRTIASGRWDVVHTHLFRTAVVVTPLARLAGARVFGTSHRIYYPRIQPRLERVLSLLQEAIVVDSAAVREILRAHTRIPLHKYAVIHNGIDVAEFDGAPDRAVARAALGLQDDELVVGEIAHLRPHKGQRHLVGAVARLSAHHPSLRLVLVGGGPDQEALEDLARTLGVADRVEFVGPRPDLPVVLAALDVLALPSTFEGFGIVQAEAMYLRLPVIATSHGGSTEVVEEGVTGFLVPFGDEDALADRIDRLAADSELRARMGEAGRRRVLERFTADAMARGYAELYDTPARRMTCSKESTTNGASGPSSGSS